MASDSDRKKVEEWTRWRYTLIGGPFTGRSGATFQAKDITEGRVVAIKFPIDADLVKWRASSKTIANEIEALDRFDQFVIEAPREDPRRQTVQALICPHDDGDIEVREFPEPGKYLVTEWAKGKKLDILLDELARRKSGLPIGSILRILTGLAHVLAVAHSLGFVNGDIDAKQIFWDDHAGEGNGKPREYLKIIDWGNAGFFDPRAGSPRIRKDLNQFGELMLHLLTGAKVLKTEVTSEADLASLLKVSTIEVSDELQRILGRALDLDGSYPTAEALSGDLERLYQKHSSEWEKQLDQADGNIREKKLDEALGLIALVQREDPANERVGESAEQLGEYQRQHQLEGLKQAARAFMEVGSWERAQEKLNAAMPLAGVEDKGQIDNLLSMVAVAVEAKQKEVDEALLAYLNANLDADEVLDRLLRSTAGESIRISVFVQGLLEQAGRHVLRDDLKAIIDKLEQEFAQAQREASKQAREKRRTLNEQKKNLETVLENLPTAADREVNQQIEWYSKSQERIKDSSKQLEGLSILSEQLNTLCQQVITLVGTFQRAHKEGLAGEWKDAESAFQTCFRIDPDNQFFYDEKTVLSNMARVDQEVAQALIRARDERRGPINHLRAQLDALEEKYPDDPYIQAMRNQINKQESYDLSSGFELLGKGQIDGAEEFAQQARREIRGSTELDCLIWLIEGTKQLYYRTHLPESDKGEDFHLSEAQHCAEEAKKKDRDHDEPEALLFSVRGYRELLNGKNLLLVRVAEAQKFLQTVQRQFPDMAYAQLLANTLEKDIEEVQQWTNELHAALSEVQDLDWAVAEEHLAKLQTSIPTRIERRLYREWLWSWQRIVRGIQTATDFLSKRKYSEAYSALREVQNAYPAQIKVNQEYGKVRALVDSAIVVSKTPDDLQSIAERSGDYRAAGWSERTHEIERALEAMANRERNFAGEHSYSQEVLGRYERVTKKLREGNQEEIAAVLESAQKEDDKDPFIKVYQALQQGQRKILPAMPRITPSAERPTASQVPPQHVWRAWPEVASLFGLLILVVCGLPALWFLLTFHPSILQIGQQSTETVTIRTRQPAPTPLVAPSQTPAAPLPAPMIVYFKSSQNTVAPKECIELTWQIEAVGDVKAFLSYDSSNEPVNLNDRAARVCPEKDTTFTLSVIRTSDAVNVTKKLDVKVNGPSPTPTATATATPTSTPTAIPARQIALVSQTDTTNNWDGASWGNHSIVYSSEQNPPFIWHLFLQNPREVPKPRFEQPVFSWYVPSFVGLQSYVVELGWVPNIGDFPATEDRGYGILFSMPDGVRYRLQLAVDPVSQNMVYALMPSMDPKVTPSTWSPCGCDKDYKMLARNKIEVQFNGEKGAVVFVNGHQVSSVGLTGFGTPNAQQVGLLIWGLPAHAQIYTAYVKVGQ